MATIPRIALALALAVFVFAACVASTDAASLQLYVSPDGDDTGPGTLADPLASLRKARDEIRSRRADGALTDGATVFVRGGIHEITQTLVLGPEDSGTADAPIVWRAYEGEDPWLVGSRQVRGQFVRWSGEVLQVDLKGSPLEGVPFQQLFYRGERMVLARFPNLDASDVHGGEWAHVIGPPGFDVRDRFYAMDGVIRPEWERVEEARVCIHPSYGWAWNVHGIESVDAARNLIVLTGNVSYGLRPGDRYFIRNLLAELDAPGEWYLDRQASILYFWPISDDGTEFESEAVLAPVVDTVIELNGARHVVVRGFTIEGCDGDAVRLIDAEHCVIARSTIRNAGRSGVAIAGGSHSGALGNDIYATGAGGIDLAGGDRRSLTRGDNYATNNHIHHTAVLDRTYRPGIDISGVGNTASRNLIHDTPHSGIIMEGNDNTVAYNTVHHTNLASEDTGCLMMGSRDNSMRGIEIRHNIFHHCGGYGKTGSWDWYTRASARFEYPNFTWGIYLDALATGIEVYGNVLYDVPICGIFNHAGSDNHYTNNIIVDTEGFRVAEWGRDDIYQVSWDQMMQMKEEGDWERYREAYPELARYEDSHALDRTMSNCRFERNILYFAEEGSRWRREKEAENWEGAMLAMGISMAKEDTAQFVFDDNLFYGEGVDLRFGLSLSPDEGRHLTFDEWQSAGTGWDQHSRFADPLFVDAANHDYRLRPESPALAMGFEPIPFDQIGPYADDLRRSWPIVEEGASELGDFTTTREFELPYRQLVEFGESGSHADAGLWRVVNDGVMGGLSQSRMSMAESGWGVFEGAVSLANNGGFASVRTTVDEAADLAQYDGLAVLAKGDGKRYRLRLRMEDAYDGIAYQASFQPRTGSVDVCVMPWTEFEATFRGRKPRGTPPLDPAKIRQVGLMIADGQEGEFRLEVLWVRAFGFGEGR